MPGSSSNQGLSQLQRLFNGHKAAVWALILLGTVILLAVYFSAQRSALERLRNVADVNTTRLTGLLDATLQRHEYLPELLAQNVRLKAFLQKPSNAAAKEINPYLRELNQISSTLDIYLMNVDGMTLASSNYDQPYSFVGNNYRFRPYFQQALIQGTGRYFALGTNSGERGYYFSAALNNSRNQLLGVVVVKVSVGQLEKEWESESTEFMITDGDGVIFMASQQDWRIKTLVSLNEDKRRTIHATRRYAQETLRTLPSFSMEPMDENHQIASLNGQRYLMTITDQPHGWRVYLLVNWESVSQAVNFALGLASLLLSLSGLLIFLLWKNQQQRRLYEQEAREELETQVEARTKELRHTQEELIQAAKMAALGQLSAAITHEINNPLSAIRAYADNANQFLERENTDMAASNLQEISALTERMAAITRQLKTFSRKSQGHIENCDLNKALDSAILIIQPKLSQTYVMLEQLRAPRAQQVSADQVWLEQIIVNLLSNAMEAVAEQENGQIWLSTEHNADNITIRVADNGPGITEEDMPHIFEEFFTTKSIGKGLGLGLSISYRLARDMQGDLQVANNQHGGAEFQLQLPLGTGI